MYTLLKSVGISCGLGRGYCSNPEWFEGNVEILKPLIDNNPAKMVAERYQIL